MRLNQLITLSAVAFVLTSAVTSSPPALAIQTLTPQSPTFNQQSPCPKCQSAHSPFADGNPIGRINK